MSKCKTPSCINFNKELDDSEIDFIRGQKVCKECWNRIDDVSADGSEQIPEVEPTQMDTPPITFQPNQPINPSPFTTLDANWQVDFQIEDTELKQKADLQTEQWSGFESPQESRTLFTPPISQQDLFDGSTDIDVVEDVFIVEEASVNFPEVIVYQGGQPRGTPYKIRGDVFMIGRSSQSSEHLPDLDFRDFVDGHKVSRHHARIIQRDGSYFIEDLDSKTGTWINEEYVEHGKSYLLEDGDIISIGGVADLEFLTSHLMGDELT